jgi:hypothetical protein
MLEQKIEIGTIARPLIGKNNIPLHAMGSYPLHKKIEKGKAPQELLADMRWSFRGEHDGVETNETT